MENLPFACAKIGDKVYSTLLGMGYIKYLCDGRVYVHSLDEEYSVTFYLNGHYLRNKGERVLFYVDENGIIRNEHPLEKLYADMLPVDTRLFIVWQGNSQKTRRYYAGNNQFYRLGTDSWSSNGDCSPLCSYTKSITLAEDFGDYKAGTPVYVRANEEV